MKRIWHIKNTVLENCDWAQTWVRISTSPGFVEICGNPEFDDNLCVSVKWIKEVRWILGDIIRGVENDARS